MDLSPEFNHKSMLEFQAGFYLEFLFDVVMNPDVYPDFQLTDKDVNAIELALSSWHNKYETEFQIFTEA